jgi:membrane protease YdiL (CAAX protease family)
MSAGDGDRAGDGTVHTEGWQGAGPLARPGFGEAILLLLMMFVAAAVALVAILLGRRDTELDIVLLGAVEVLGLLFALVVGLRIARVPWHEPLALRPVPLWMLLAVVPLTGAASVVSSEIEAWMAALVPVPPTVAVEMARLLYADDAASWVRVVLAVAVVIPVGEELFFRGLLLRGFLLRYGPGPALVLTAALFALVHLNPWGLVSIFLVGILLGWLVLRTGSLWPACLAHGLYNFAAVVSLNTSLDAPPSAAALDELLPRPFASPLLLAGAVVVIGLLMRLLADRSRRGAPWGPPTGQPAPSPPTI